MNTDASPDAGATRPTYVEVDLARLGANYEAIAAHVSPASMMPILKANAYGHGLVEIAQHLSHHGPAAFGVAFLEEAITLRRAGIETPILVLGGLVGNQLPLFISHDVTVTASSVDKVRQIDEAAAALGRTAKVHLKIDTGMGRIGTQYYSADSLFEAALAAEHLTVEAVYSHFAAADEKDVRGAKEQVARFDEAIEFYPQHGLEVPPRHMANSGAILQLPEAHYEIVRPGILLYGVYPSDEVPRAIEVQPSLSWKTKVVYFKVLKPGHGVSYGSTWAPRVETRIVTLPVGYGDGYFRKISNRGEVIIHGTKYPIVGRVCMDQTMVDIGWDSAYNEDEVVLLGTAGDATITAEDVARWADTIPYEVLTNINARVPRVYINGG